jgi:hypothetical protein
MNSTKLHAYLQTACTAAVFKIAEMNRTVVASAVGLPATYNRQVLRTSILEASEQPPVHAST